MEPLLVTAKQICDRRILPFAVRTLRRMDAGGLLPRGVTIGRSKCWRMSDLQKWVAWKCPGRREFEQRVREEAGDN